MFFTSWRTKKTKIAISTDVLLTFQFAFLQNHCFIYYVSTSNKRFCLQKRFQHKNVSLEYWAAILIVRKILKVPKLLTALQLQSHISPTLLLDFFSQGRMIARFFQRFSTAWRTFKANSTVLIIAFKKWAENSEGAIPTDFYWNSKLISSHTNRLKPYIKVSRENILPNE